MNPLRRAWLIAAGLGIGLPGLPASSAVAASAAAPDPVRRGRPLVFPRDHGAHPGSAIEWWYATGWAGNAAQPRWGFQVTFFRARTGLADGAGRFAAPQLLFAHAALTDLQARRHHHADRIVRWNGHPDAAPGAASTLDGAVRIGRWTMRREGGEADSRWRADIDGDFRLSLTMQRTQPLLRQGDAGFSRKGPQEAQASHYYSEPQLATRLALRLDGRSHEADGRAWLDQEWSDALMHEEAVGWDWIGINLDDGRALTAFQMRRAGGRALWAGGSLRAPGSDVRAFAPDEVAFTPLRHWTSPATGARYPVHWRVDTPAGSFQVEALLDAQEVDGRRSTGTLYWEGLTRLTDANGRRVGLGYLELTGYGQRLRLGDS